MPTECYLGLSDNPCGKCLNERQQTGPRNLDQSGHCGLWKKGQPNSLSPLPFPSAFLPSFPSLSTMIPGFPPDQSWDVFFTPDVCRSGSLGTPAGTSSCSHPGPVSAKGLQWKMLTPRSHSRHEELIHSAKTREEGPEGTRHIYICLSENISETASV